jgi:tetratricopeptide (TPR) repeat protein
VAVGKQARARELLDAGAYREAGELFVAAGELASAARAFVAAKEYFRAAVCYEKALKPLDAARLYQQIRHWSKAAELYRQAGDAIRAEFVVDQLRKDEAEEARNRGPATGWAHAPVAAATGASSSRAPGAGRPATGPAAPQPADASWPPGEIWQAMRAGNVAAAAELYLRQGGNAGWTLLSEAASPEARRGLAETLLQAGEYAVAAEAFQKIAEPLRAAQCLSLAGLNEEAAHYYYNLGQKAVAAQHLEKAHSWEQAAAIYLQENLFLDAARCYEKNDDPSKAAALFLKARKPDLALPLLQSVSPAHASFTACRLLAAKILFQKGQQDLALSMLAPLLQTAPTTEEGLETLYQTAVLMEAGGAVDRAREAYHHLQEARYGFKDVTERLRQLSPPAGGAAIADASAPAAAAAAPPPSAAPAPPRRAATAAKRAAAPPAAPPASSPPPSPATTEPEDADVAVDLAPLRDCSLFNRLGLEDLRRIWMIGKTGEVRPGKVLVKAGEVAAGLMVVLTGGVTITPDPADPKLSAGFLGPGDYVGLGSLLNGPPQANYLVAQKGTALLVLPIAAFDALLSSDPEMGMRFYRSVAEHLVQTIAADKARSLGA